MEETAGWEKTLRNGRNRRTTLLLVLCIVLGLGLILYPGFSERWNRKRQGRAIAKYTAAVENGDSEEQELMLENAREYNKMIAEKGIDLAPEHFDAALYESELSMNGMDTMCYIDIPRVNVNLPVYHGTSEATMQVAVGHLEGTSLPVGGESTHCVLTGHRGLPTARLFTDLDQLQIGDIFTLYTLKEELVYQVDQLRVIEPYDLSTIQIEPGKDLVSLITCTPYGINTQRLAVRGRRIDSPLAGPEEKAGINGKYTSDATQIDPSGAAPVIAAPLLILVLAVISIRNRRNRALKRRALEKLLEEGITV